MRAAAKEREERQRKRDAITRPPERTDGLGERVVLYTQVGGGGPHCSQILRQVPAPGPKLFPS